MMASFPSILKTTINLKYAVITELELVTVIVHKYKQTHEQKQIHMHIRPYLSKQGRCPKCGNKCPGYDTKHKDNESQWRAPDLNGLPVYIRYTPRRIRCPEHGVLTEMIPWADGDSRFTEDFNNEVAWLVTQMSKTAIADFLGINWRTVGNCIKAAMDRLEPDVSNRLHGLTRICVDETSYSKGYKYVTVVYDIDRNRVVWVHEGNGLNTFRKFCEALSPEERSKIEIVAGDGARWIDACVQEYFPNAKRCVDPFHVVEWVNTALDEVRSNTATKARREYDRMKKEFEKADQKDLHGEEAAEEFLSLAKAELAELEAAHDRKTSGRRKELKEFIRMLKGSLRISREEQRLKSTNGETRKRSLSPERQQQLDELEKRAKDVKGAKHALGHKPENRTERQNEKIKLIENSFPDLYQAFQLKESLRLIIHMRDPGLAAVELKKWIQDASSCSLEPMAKLSEKIERHYDNIMNSITYHANSSRSESVNTTIKVLIRMARGFRNLDNMMALIYLKCSDLIVPLNNRPKPSADLLKQRRERANELRREREEANRMAAAQA